MCIWNIHNVNLSIKYEGIRLQKCSIACKKGINVVVRLENLPQSIEKKKKKSTPYQHLQKSAKFF